MGVSEPVFYPTSLCPAVFKHARIESLYLSNLSEKNRPNFLTLNQTNLDSMIRSVHIQSSEIELDARLLEPNVFRRVEKISVEFSNLTRIERGTLAPFRALRALNLWLNNFGQFIRQDAENSWLADLNAQADEIDLSSHITTRYLSRRKVTIDF